MSRVTPLVRWRAQQHEHQISRPLVMGILNVTPDSFYDGGRHYQLDAALHLVEQMVLDGADYIDIGGESTRPSAVTVSEAEECDRVLPTIESVAARFDIAISVDTSRPLVIRAACEAGASLVNDVRALQVDGALLAAAESDVDVCLMHMRGDPGNMQDDPTYVDVVETVREFLAARTAVCRAAGIASARIAVDPGIGFGKTLEHNLRLLNALDQVAPDNSLVVLGASRKSLFGQLLGRAVDDRLYASLAAAVDAAGRGVAMVRVHDVGATVDALDVWAAINSAN